MRLDPFPGLCDHKNVERLATALSDVKSYDLVAKLATGGMAEIFLAKARGGQGFEKYVVLKRILPERASDQRFVQMFLDEARLAATLHHHNIAQVYDFGEIGNNFFFTMEYVHGEDLGAILKVTGGMPLAQALTVVTGAAAGLHYAHEKVDSKGRPLRVVHRDVSLSNIIVTFDGGVKLLDFGVAQAAQRTKESSGGIKGKLAYLSPEQIRGGAIDRRSDIFSLGIVLYELTTGTRAFGVSNANGAMDYSVMERIVGGDFARPSQVVEGYPAELERIVLRALAVDVDQRFATAREFLLALEQFAASAGIALSQAALAAYMHSVFGNKPEAWRELDPSQGDSVDKTVTLCLGSDVQFVRGELPLPPEEASEVYDSVPALAALPRLDTAAAVTAPMDAEMAAKSAGRGLVSRRFLGRLALYAVTVVVAVMVGLLATLSAVKSVRNDQPVQLLVIDEAPVDTHSELVDVNTAAQEQASPIAVPREDQRSQDPATEEPSPGELIFDEPDDVSDEPIVHSPRKQPAKAVPDSRGSKPAKEVHSAPSRPPHSDNRSRVLLKDDEKKALNSIFK